MDKIEKYKNAIKSVLQKHNEGEYEHNYERV